MLHIGCHLSCAKGYLAMGRQALALGADTFQFFTRNPRGGNAKPLDEADALALRDLMRERGFAPVIAHAPYTLNACAADPATRDFARRAMTEDVRRLSLLPGAMFNFHPGCHVGQGTRSGVALIAALLREVLEETEDTPILLETMAGKGTEIGGRFEELRDILDAAGGDARLGVCLDTCHVFDAGYDLAGDLQGVLDALERAVGLERLRAVHLNDSKNPRGSRKDRHARLGEGEIGVPALRRAVLHPALRALPFVLETPNEPEGYAREIAMARGWDEEDAHVG